MRTKFSGILTLFLAFIVQFTFAQEKTVSGTVTDDKGLPLPGVNVIIKNTANGTQTDFDGNYSITANKGAVLSFSYVGFQVVDKVVGDGDTVNAQLAPSAAELEEVVITGQGSGISRRKLSTTVDFLTADEVDKLPSNQIDQLLQSTTPSAQIRLSSGQPGTAAIIRTRGAISASSSATPVVIIDGVRVDNLNSNPQLGLATGGADVSALADIPVESIEKIEYIKGGAATTLYGADAANGVIQIITKKGTSGKARFSYEARVGVIKATDDYLWYERTGEALFKPGLSIEHKIGINGGNEKVTYNFAGSLYADDSFNLLNEQVRRNLSFGLGAQVNDKLRYQGSFSYVGFESNLDYNANTSFSRFSAFEGGGRGNLDELTDAQWQAELDRSNAIGEEVSINNTVNRLTNSNKFIYDFTDNIQANATIGIDTRTQVQEENQTNAFQIALGSIAAGTSDQAILNRLIRNAFTVTGDLNFTHRGRIDNFEFVTVLGGQFFRTTDRQYQTSGSGGVDGTTDLGLFPTQLTDDFFLENANYGVYFLENIGIYDVAFLEFGARLDQNTQAGDDTDPLLLPKVGITYNISDHDFYYDSGISKVLSTVKLRANYGEATNFAQAFSEDRTFALNPFLGQPSFTFLNPGNPDLISETVITTEFGMELGLFNDRINLSGTRYVATTEDALFTPPSLPTSGQLNQIRNIGEIKNEGWEFALSADVIKTEKHNLNINASYNINDNVVVSTGGAPAFNVGGFNVIGSWVEEGQSLGYLRGTSSVRQADGTFLQTPNDALGDTFAPNFGSFGFNYTWNNKLNIFMTGDYQFGGKIVDLSFLLRHLRGVDDTGIPADLVGTTSPFNYVNFFTFDNDFIKIRNIGASYAFGDVLGLFDDLKIGFTVTNPFNFAIDGQFDPETTGSGIGNQNGFGSGGFAYGTESAPRIFMTSLRFQF
ncbi:TonB-dependent receptor [Aquimarina sp. AD10]|uniref:TonB-dependent receptor plug domain-containing protein n=1 Tax=Aquimarina sp. AD10 TaxID=1714849 RepID=UPI000E476014|nr:TonB-dependent receptor plug domain-containing protein [Aquimarina sp. AD10]AXT62919.1 TonB-dependent receptor [Aquimarina sp. AD10]RKM94634.1 TonB-dependent receptor [Aquimarina sp. AD10]